MALAAEVGEGGGNTAAKEEIPEAVGKDAGGECSAALSGIGQPVGEVKAGGPLAFGEFELAHELGNGRGDDCTTIVLPVAPGQDTHGAWLLSDGDHDTSALLCEFLVLLAQVEEGVELFLRNDRSDFLVGTAYPCLQSGFLLGVF